MKKGCFAKQRLLMKAISLVLVVAVINSYVLSDAWAAVDAGKAPYKMSLEPEAGFARLDVETFTIPAHLGEVRYSFKGPSKKFIIHIQDAHCNVFAQRKVADIIDYLSKEHGIESVNLEGGAGEYDLEIFTSITGKAIRREVAEYFVKKGEINGAEFYAINNPGKVQLWGIEDKNLYLANLKVYRESLAYKPEVERYLEELTYILNNLKRHIYTPELLKVDMAYNAYKAGNLDFREYLEFLVEKAEEHAVQVKQFGNLYLLFQAMELEEKVDFKKANTERSVLIGELKEGLSRNEARELVTMTVDFKTKKVSRKAFYSYLLKKAAGLGLDVGRFQALSNYIVYVSTYEAADRSKVMEEMDELEAEIKGKIYRNKTERELNVLSRNLALMKNIFDIALTKTDYKYYLANKGSFDIANYLKFINKEAPRYKISARPDPGITDLDGYRERISRFYEYSFKRDDVFIKNLRFSDTAAGIKGTILMTGGFHTENLCDIFRKKGISYVSILPKFTIEKDYESPYFDILAGETTNLQQMLRSVIAQAALLQVASLLSPVLAGAVWGDAGVYAFKAAVLIQKRIAEGKRVVLLRSDGTAVTGPDGSPIAFGEDKGETENISVAGLLAEAGYTGEVAEDALGEEPLTVPEEEAKEPRVTRRGMFQVGLAAAGAKAVDWLVGARGVQAAEPAIPITEEMVRGMIFAYNDRNKKLDLEANRDKAAALINFFLDLARISKDSNRALVLDGKALGIFSGVKGAEAFPWDKLKKLEIFPGLEGERARFRAILDIPAGEWYKHETEMENEKGEKEKAVFALPNEVRFTAGKDTEGYEGIYFPDSNYALQKELVGPNATVRYIRRDDKGTIHVSSTYILFEAKLSKPLTPIIAGNEWIQANTEKPRELPPGFTGIAPAIRAWQSALLAVLPATLVAMGSAMVIMAGFGTPLMFILHTVLSFQALLMSYQTLRAYAIERDPKREGKPAASSDEVYSELRERFGPVLAPIVNFHERVHNWNARNGIKEGSLLDELIAYGLTYVISSFLLLFYVGKAIDYKLFPHRIDEELLGYKTEIYLESDHKRMIRNPRWKELFPKRNIRMNRANPRMVELDDKQMVVPGAIMGGPETGSNFFRIENELGKGGFGAAFRAKVVKGRMKGRDVAVKILKPGSPPDTVIKFLQEYLIMKRLEDIPGVIRPYEAGYYEVNGEKYYYIAMQFADGGDMNNEMKLRRAEMRVGRRDELFTEEEVYDVAERLLKTINAIHKKGVIHGDLKPANLFYINGELKVADFGISRFAPTGAVATDTLTGTTEYLPNVMLRDFFVHGNNAQYTAKTDLYAIGLVLYQLLNDGRLPQHKSDEEKEKLEELFDKREYKQWVDRKERRSASETIRLLGKSRAHTAETSELEKFIAMLLLENEEGINRGDDAVKKISSSSATRKIRLRGVPGAPRPGRAGPMPTAERERLIAMRTVDIGPPQIDTGAETVDLSSPGVGSRSVAQQAAEFFAEPPAVIPPRGLDDLAGSETADLPSRSLFANLLSQKFPWFNFVLRTLAIFSTPLHEAGHIIAARLNGVFVNWSLAGLITGEVRTGRITPLMRVGGVVANLSAAAVSGLVLLYANMPPFALSSALLWYVATINIVSALFELGGAFGGTGDIAYREPFDLDKRVSSNLTQDMAEEFYDNITSIREEDPVLYSRALQVEDSWEDFQNRYFDADFFSNYRMASDDGEDLKEFLRTYLRAAVSVKEGSLYEEGLYAGDIIKFRRYFYRIYGNQGGEKFNAQEILPNNIQVNFKPSILARIMAWIKGDMIITGAFRGMPERGQDRTFVIARYRGQTMAFYKSISHGVWRRIEALNTDVRNISKPVAENALELSRGLNGQLDALFAEGGLLAAEDLENIGNEFDALRENLSEGRVPLLNYRSPDADRYGVYNKIGLVPDTQEQDRDLSEAWFQKNLSQLKEPRLGIVNRVLEFMEKDLIAGYLRSIVGFFAALFMSFRTEVVDEVSPAPPPAEPDMGRGPPSIPPAFAEGMEIKNSESYYASVSEKDGVPVEIGSPEDAVAFARKRISMKRIVPVVVNGQRLVIEGKPVEAIVEEGIDINGPAIGELIKEALISLDGEGDIGRLPTTLVIAQLDRSPYMFEDHVRNGFIGVNRVINEIPDRYKVLRQAVLKMGIAHELSHELSGRSGPEFEAEQLKRDAKYLMGLMRAGGMLDLAGQLTMFLNGNMERNDFSNAMYFQELFSDANRMGVDLTGAEDNVDQMLARLAKAQISHLLKRGIITEYGLKELARFYKENPIGVQVIPGTVEYDTRLNIANMSPLFQRIKDRDARRNVVLETVKDIETVEKTFDIGSGDGALAGPEEGSYGHRFIGGKSVGRSERHKREIIYARWGEEIDLLYIKVKQSVKRTQGELAEQGYDLDSGMAKGLLIKAVFEAIRDNVDFDESQTDKYAEFHYVLDINKVLSDKKGVCRHMGILVGMMLEKLIQENLIEGMVFYVRPAGRGHGFATYVTSSGDPIVLDVAQSPKTDPFTGEEGFRTFGYLDDFRKITNNETDLRLQPRNDNEKAQWWLWFRRYAHGVYDIVEKDQTVAEMIRERREAVEARREALGLGFDERTIIGRTLIPGDDDISQVLRDAKEGRKEEVAPEPDKIETQPVKVEPPSPEVMAAIKADIGEEKPEAVPKAEAPAAEVLEGIPVPEEEVNLNELFAPVLGNITTQFNFNLVTRQDWEDYKALVRNSPGAQTVSNIISSIVSRITTSEEPYKEIFLMDRETGSPIFNSLVDGLFDEGKIKTERETGLGPAVTGWLRRNTWGMPGLMRSLIAAPVAEETVYRGLPLVLTSIAAFIFTSGLDWMLIMHGMIVPQIFMAGKFVMDHARGNRSPPEVFRLLLVPSLVAVANAAVLPFLMTNPLAFMGLSVFNHFLANLVVAILNAVFPKLELGEAMISRVAIWEGMEKFVDSFEGIDEAEDIQDILTDIMAIKLDQITEDVSAIKGMEFDYFIIESVEFEGRGDFNSVFSITADTNIGQVVFGLRLLTPRVISDFDSIKQVANEGVKLTNNYETGDKVIKIQKSYFINEDLDDYMSEILENAGIYGFTIGDFISGTDLDKVEEDQRRESYRKAIKSLVDLWLNTYDTATATGMVMYDLKGANFVRQYITGDVFVADTGAIFPLDFNDLKGLIDQWLKETRGVEPGSEESEYFRGAINEAVREFFVANRHRISALKISALELVTGVMAPPPEPIRAPLKLTAAETREVLGADLRRLGPEGVQMLADVVAGKMLSPSKIVGQKKVEISRKKGETEEVLIPEAIKGVTGDYQIKEKLGSGGFGAVMKAKTTDGRDAAIKVLLPGAGPDITLKFFTEYLMMRELSDVDSVVDAYEIGTYKLNGQRYFYMVQEFAGEGMSLWDFMQWKARVGDKFREEEVESIAAELLEALGKIHEKGIIHADIKPANILVSRDKLKITDFGLSLYAPEGLAELGMGRFQGTPGYISTGSMINGEYRAKTDLFALGHILYELMNNGQSPYEMTDETYENILNESDQVISPTLVRWAKDRDVVIERINAEARTPMERLAAKLLLENIEVQDGWLDEADRGGLETVGDALIMMTGVELPEGLEDLAPPEVPVALDDIMPAQSMGDRVAPQIGKRARVIGIKEVDGKKYMQVETTEGRKKKKIIKDIELARSTREKGGNIETLREFLSLVRATLPPERKEYDSLIKAFIDVIDQSDPEDLPEFYTYSGKDLVADVFGYASAKPGENLIVVNEDITRFDLAWLHEFGEYLMRPEVNRLQPRFEDGKLALYLDGEMMGDAVTLEGEPLAQAMKDPANPHYLLRAFQREVFTSMDKILTEDIKTRQIASILRDRMGEQVWTEPGMDSYRAAKGIRDFIREREARYKADDRIVVSYTVEGEQRERSFLLKEGTGDLVRFDVKDLEDLSRGRFVGAEMEILITGADPATQSPEEMERYMELARTAEGYLNGLTRNKLMDELRRITGDETLRFSDLGKDIYITDHIEGSNKHVFKIEFKSTDNTRTYTIAVATKTEQAAGDITAYEIRELKELQKRPTQVVPRIGSDKMWNGKRWFTEEFVEGRTATQLARAGELTLGMRKKIVALLLSIAVGLKGLTPLDIHGGNFVVRDNGEVVMVDIGERRFRLIREASANIENEEPRKKHKMLFLATLMAQYGFFSAEEDAAGQRTIAGVPENNHFIFEAVTENKDLAGGEGLELLREVYEYFKQRQDKDPETIAQAFSDFKYRGGFRNVLYPLGISFTATTEEMLPALVPFSNLFMESLGSYLAKVESRRGPPEEEPIAEAPPEEAPALMVETEPFDAMSLGKGFAMDYKGETVHMRGIAPDPRIVRNYLKTLRLRNPDDSLVVPDVRKVYLPMTTMWKRGPSIEEKTEDELPAETVDLLRAASEEGLFELVELKNLGDYDRAAEEIGADRDKFRTLLYTSLIPFMSDYAGRNAQVYLMNQIDFVKDEGQMREFGRAIARTLKTLHTNGIIAGDTHLGQFVVPPDGKHILRVDLVNIYSFDDIEEGTIPDNVAAEYMEIFNTLKFSNAAAEAFSEVYTKEDMAAIGLGAGVGKVQIKTARGAVQDLRSGVVDWIVTPGNEEMMMSAKPAVDRSASRKFRREYGSDTLTEGYVYKAGMSDEELTANLKKTFEDMLENMSRPEYSDKKPRAIIYAPAERYDLVNDILDNTLKDMKLEKFGDRITVLREGGIPDDGAVDEVMHVVLGKALLNYERFRKGDYEDVFGAESQKRLADLLKAMVMDPAAIDLVKDPAIIDKILDGIVELKIRAIDYEEIRDWKAAQDEILRSL